MGISQYKLAKTIGVPAMRISEITEKAEKAVGESLARIEPLAA